MLQVEVHDDAGESGRLARARGTLDQSDSPVAGLLDGAPLILVEAGHAELIVNWCADLAPQKAVL